MKRRLTAVEWQSICAQSDGRRVAGGALYDVAGKLTNCEEKFPMHRILREDAGCLRDCQQGREAA